MGGVLFVLMKKCVYPVFLACVAGAFLYNEKCRKRPRLRELKR